MVTSSFPLIVTISIMAFAVFNPSTAKGGNPAHAHIGHVMSGWKGTPGNKGLLPAAFAEAKIAVQHAGFSAKKPRDLAWMKTHTRHVLHAVDPSVESKGPGLGYGVIKAAMGAGAHINFAAESKGASKNVQAHTTHVSASLQNTVFRAKEIVELGKRVLKANSVEEAAPLVKKINLLANRLMAGEDANADGKITWKPGEGGLAEAQKHMGFMMKGEGLN